MINDLALAFDVDSTPKSHQIINPVYSGDDIAALFDTITYSKVIMKIMKFLINFKKKISLREPLCFECSSQQLELKFFSKESKTICLIINIKTH